MTSLNDIAGLTRLYADAREGLGDQVTQLNAKIEALKREYLPAIKRLVGRAAERQDVLKQAIEGAPELFEKPRTQIFHGIKVGWQKQKGTIEWDDADLVVQLCEKHFPELANLIRVKKTPNKDAIADLRVQDLKKIGCRVVESSDEVIIKPADSEVDKVVTALLKDATDTAAEKAA